MGAGGEVHKIAQISFGKSGVVISYTTATNTDDLTMKRDLRNDALCVRGLSLAHTLLLKVNFGLAVSLNTR